MRGMIAPLSDQRTDPELLEMLAEPTMWLVRGTAGPILAIAQNLQSALTMAFEQSRIPGQTVHAIVRMPNDNIVIKPEQIYRLWQHFRFIDQHGHHVGGQR